jgi:hypothetical protein
MNPKHRACRINPVLEPALLMITKPIHVQARRSSGLEDRAVYRDQGGGLSRRLHLEHTLVQPVSGRVGLWSKADSHMYFADYTVAAAD